MLWCKSTFTFRAIYPDAIYRHLKYTIPPAIALTFVYRPLCTRLDVYKVLFLISVAVIAATPWDSYLVRRKIWTYPPSVIIGPTLFSIPAEEIFFFVVQTYNTSLVYLCLSKPVFKQAYLVGSQADNGRLLPQLQRRRLVGQIIIAGIIGAGVWLICKRGTGTYMGLILVWTGPFSLLLWTLAYQFLQTLPYMNTLLPIALPTVYLWLIDTLALRRGTWAIESGTKLGMYLWPGLEVEEALFFLVTNAMIVLGLVAFENAVAVVETFPDFFPDLSDMPSPILLVKGLALDPAKYDNERIRGIQEAVVRLKNKSRSFYLASSVFSGRLRIDLILL
jgi:15-cis-phytoene synthase / lycopene beta-cyclase